MTIGLPPDHSINEVAGDNENPFDFLPENRHVTPIPELGNIEDENPFQQLSDTRPLTPIPDLHLRDDNGGPSEPISWAFQRQGLGDIDPRISPLGTFGEQSSPQRPTSPSPTAIGDIPIDPNLLQLSPAGPTLQIVQSPADRSPATTRTVTEANAHPLTSFSASRSAFVFDTFVSGGLSKAAPTATNTPSAANVFDIRKTHFDLG